jgi:hypothetical protein
MGAAEAADTGGGEVTDIGEERHAEEDEANGWWYLPRRRYRHAPKAVKRESQARRMRPTGTIQSSSVAGWNATTHQTITLLPIIPAAATPATAARNVHDEIALSSNYLASPFSMSTKALAALLAPDSCCRARAAATHMRGVFGVWTLTQQLAS